MRQTKDAWEQKEDEVIKEYIRKNYAMTNARIADVIEKERPEGVKSIRYGNTSLGQHVAVLKREVEKERND